MNTCYTYFSIKGNFEPDDITEILGLHPFESHKEGESRARGNGVYSCSTWNFGRCNEYNVNVNEQIRKTISPLLDKIELLKHIKDKYAVDFYIEVVPEIHVGESVPILGLDLDIIDFCHETRTVVDIDMYVLEQCDSAD
ncbi:MAG: DUF4279 domain-containing protein [Clostridia bacterium]|nr:DUF4279 domain-containing protein [Clostridia bacterium]